MTSLPEHVQRSRHHRQPRPSLDEYLKARADRCDGCGYAVSSQGHGTNCAPIAPEWTGAITPAEWATFTAALKQVARGGEVHQRDMRPLIRGRIEPKHIGSCYKRAIREGLLNPIGHEESNDIAGKNAGRLEPRYELRGAA